MVLGEMFGVLLVRLTYLSFGQGDGGFYHRRYRRCGWIPLGRYDLVEHYLVCEIMRGGGVTPVDSFATPKRMRIWGLNLRSDMKVFRTLGRELG